MDPVRVAQFRHDGLAFCPELDVEVVVVAVSPPITVPKRQSRALLQLGLRAAGFENGEAEAVEHTAPGQRAEAGRVIAGRSRSGALRLEKTVGVGRGLVPEILVEQPRLARSEAEEGEREPVGLPAP